MGRPKGSKNKIQSGIAYPRKCEHCDYMSNNPSMYHYHRRLHEEVPVGQLCDLGCNQQANFRNTKGTYSCSKVSHHCPAYIKQHSDRVKEQWQRPEALARKEQTKERFFKHCCGVPEVLAKQKATLKQKWGDFTPEQMKDFRHYARRVRATAQRWAKEQGYELGQQTYHVDHKFSVWEAWKANVSESIVNHPFNLQVLEAKENSSKGARCSITLAELLEATCPPSDGQV